MSDMVTVAVRETLAAIVETAPEAPELPAMSEHDGARWRLSPSVALAAAAAFVVVVVGVAVVLFAGSDSEPADPPVTSTTVAPTTTEAGPTSTTVAPTTTSVVEAVAPPVMDWERLPLGGSGEVGTVVAAGTGLVAGGDADGVPMLWTSDDGVTWREVVPSSAVADTPLVGGVQDLAFDGGSVVGLFGNRVWHSTDLAVWTPADDSPFMSEGAVDLRAVTHGPAGFVVVGYETEPDNDALISHGLMWYSADGITWTRHEDEAFDLAAAYDVVYHDDQYVAVGLDWSPVPLHEGIWTSIDGRTWSPVDGWDPNGGMYMEGVTSSSDGLYAIGNYSPGLAIPEQEGNGCTAIWHSPDAASWTRIDAPQDTLCDRHGAYGYAIVTQGTRIVGVGQSHPKSAAASQAGTWASDDLGTTWARVDQPDSVFGVDANAIVYMFDIAVLDDTYVAGGVYDAVPTIWIGSWKE